ESEAPFLDRLDGLIGGRCDVARELRAFFVESRKHAAALFGQNSVHFVGAPADRSGDLLGLAEEIACDFFANADQSALGLSRAGADRLGGGQCKLAKRALGFRRIDLNDLAELLQPRVECIGGCLAAGFNLAGDRFGPADEELLETADTTVEIVR